VNQVCHFVDYACPVLSLVDSSDEEVLGDTSTSRPQVPIVVFGSEKSSGPPSVKQFSRSFMVSDQKRRHPLFDGL
jgi:hypothetical protein